ncbi:MAG: CarD family transcriptional regulator [Spirochaetota bacterium]|nr:CarD family transcriptional regulator [Spirochaetota bacterium]
MMFEEGQKVVYPMHGVGIIDKIEEREILGKKQIYYSIKLVQSGMTVMIPVEQSEKIRLRELYSGKLLTKVFSTLKNPCENLHFDWKIRYSNNHEKLKEGSITSLTEVVRDLFHRNQIKELSRGEKKLYDSAFQLLCDELSYSEEMDQEKIKVSILEKLKSTENVPV